MVRDDRRGITRDQGRPYPRSATVPYPAKDEVKVGAQCLQLLAVAVLELVEGVSLRWCDARPLIPPGQAASRRLHFPESTSEREGGGGLRGGRG